MWRQGFSGVLAALAVAGAVSLPSGAEARAYQVVPETLLVTLAPGTSDAAARALLASAGASSVERVSRLAPVYQVEAERSDLTGLAGVVAAEVPGVVYPAAARPADRHFNGAWWLAGPRTTRLDGWLVPTVGANARAAWDVSRGQGVVVAVVDTGVQLTHPDLAARIWRNPGEIPGNGLDDDGNGVVDDVHGADFGDGDASPNDVNGHGTHVAGIVAGSVNGKGMVGVAPRATIMPVKVFADASGYATVTALAAGIDYAAANGAHVINLSLGAYSGGWPAVEAVVAEARARGAIVVAAAGNGGVDGFGTDNDEWGFYPASYDGVVAVAATNHKARLTAFSNYGAERVDIAAPGREILSAYPKNRYVWMSGTSMASPIVAGAAALVWAARPALTAAEVEDALLASVDRRPALSGLVASGGTVNAYRALVRLGRRDRVAPPPFRRLGPPATFRLARRSAVVFRWQRTEADPVSYRLVVNGRVRASVGESAPSVRLVLPPGKYRWHVVARDRAGNLRRSR